MAMREKVTTLMWLPRAVQISCDICRTPSCLVPLMKTESRVMEVNRIYQSTGYRSFPSKEKQGICHPSAGCHDNAPFSQSEVVVSYFSQYECNQTWIGEDQRTTTKVRLQWSSRFYALSLKTKAFSSSKKLPDKEV